MKTTTPLLSVVIPTYCRPQFLSRAINSALGSAPDNDVEVIVVPNGEDDSWKSVASHHKSDLRVKWQPIAKANANAARNHGMGMARGTYLRFLDDDDYYFTGPAQEQLSELVRAGADLSFANIDRVDANDKILERLQQLTTNDYIAAALSPTHSTATIALTYKRSLTHGAFWDEGIKKRQDVYWMWSLCIKNEISAIRCDSTVGAWVDHHLPRLSTGHPPNITLATAASRLIATSEALDRQGRLNCERGRAAADYLWQCVHQGLMYSPLYWSRVAQYAKQLHREGRPALPMYRNPLVRKIDPLLCESAIVPWRWVKTLLGHHYRV